MTINASHKYNVGYTPHVKDKKLLTFQMYNKYITHVQDVILFKGEEYVLVQALIELTSR